MDVEYWQRLKAAFAQLYELDPQSRSAYLVRVSQEDFEFACELTKLLQADEAADLRDWWPVGRELGRAEDFRGSARFQVQTRLGVGGFGVVYRVFDQTEGRVIALKVLRVLDTQGLQAFKREFRLVAGLVHPNVVAVYDLFIEQDHAYFTMELVDGEPITLSLLATRVDSGRHSFVSSVREAFCQLCSGLTALHRAGIVHRDLKPSNVLRCSTGRVVILDFGQGASARKREVSAGGTPAYLAPEARAQPRGGAAADFYAVGLMLFESIVGRRPDPTDLKRPLAALRSALGLDADPCDDAQTNNLIALCDEFLREQPSSRPTEHRIFTLLRDCAELVPVVPSSRRRRLLRTPELRPTLFGRGEQLGALMRKYERAKAGRFALARVIGPSGIGKTALISEFLHQVEELCASAFIVRGGCQERESLGSRVFDAIVDELAESLRDEGAAFCKEVTPVYVDQLVRLFPQLRESFPSAVPNFDVLATRGPATEQRQLAFAGLLELLANISRRHFLVLFADDLQWADEDSHQLLQYLIQSSASLPILLVLSHRDDEDAVRNVSRKWHPKDGLSPENAIVVPSLRPEDSRALISHSLGEHHPLTTVALATRDGAPFLLNLLVDVARAKGSDWSSDTDVDDVDTLVLRCLEHLSVDARRFMDLLSIAGRPLPRQLVLKVLGVSWAALRDLEDQLRVRRLLRIVKSDYLDLFHHRLAAALRSRLSDPQTAALHALVVDALTHDADPELVAHHCLGARRYELAIRFCWLAARKCSSALAFERAASYYRQLLTLGEAGAGKVHAELADVLADAGKGKDAASSYLRASESLPDRALEYRMRAGQQLLQSGQLVDGRQLLLEVLADCGVSVPRSRLVIALTLPVLRLGINRRGAHAVFPGQQCSARDKVVLEGLWSLSSSLALSDTIGAAYFEARFLECALECGDSLSVVRALSLEAIYATIEGRASEKRVQNLLDAAEGACAQSFVPHARAMLDMALCIVHWLAGNFRACLQYATSAERSLAQYGRGFAFEMGTIRAFAFAASLWMGKLRAHADRFPALIADARERGDIQAETSLVLLAHAHIHWLSLDRPEEAELAIQAALSRWPQTREMGLQHVWALFSRVEVALYRGDWTLAANVLEDEWGKLRRSSHMRIAPIRIWFSYLRVRVWLRFAMESCTKRGYRRALKIASAESARLGREALPLGHTLGWLCRGLIEVQRNQGQRAQSNFELAAIGFENLGMELFATATKWVSLHSDEDALERTHELETAVREKGVVAPARFLGLMVAGTPRVGGPSSTWGSRATTLVR